MTFNEEQSQTMKQNAKRSNDEKRKKCAQKSQRKCYELKHSHGIVQKRCIFRVAAHSIPFWHDIMLSVGRSFRSNYSTSSFLQCFGSPFFSLCFLLQISHVLTQYIPISNSVLHSQYEHRVSFLPLTSLPFSCFVFRVSPFAYVMALIFDDFHHLKRRKTIQGNAAMQHKHTFTSTNSATKKEKRLVHKVLGFPLPVLFFLLSLSLLLCKPFIHQERMI